MLTIQSNYYVATVAISDTHTKRCHATEFRTEIVAHSVECDCYVLVPEHV